MSRNGTHIAFRPMRYLLILALLMILAMVPFSASILGVSRLQLGELCIPLLFVFSLIDAVATRNGNLFFPERGNLHPVFVTLFMFVVLVSYARNPVTPSSVVGDSEGGFKYYWRFLCSFMTYLTVIYWINRNRIPLAQVLNVLFYIVLGVTLAGMFMLLTGLKIPGLDLFAWTVNVTAGIGGAAGSTRVPFMEVFAQTGFFLVLVIPQFGRTLKWSLLAYFAICIYSGGGRASLVSTIIGIIGWLFLNRKFMLTGIIVTVAFFAFIFAQALNEIAPTPQLKRLTQLGSLEESSFGRYQVFMPLIDEFLDNPIIGTGFGKSYDIGLIREGRNFKSGDLIEGQLRYGSHTTHLQILKNLGIVGYIPFILIWLYPVYKLLPVAMGRSGDYPGHFSHHAQFCIVLILTLMIRMLVEGNGGETRLYIYAAIISSLITQISLISNRSSLRAANFPKTYIKTNPTEDARSP